MSIRKAIARAVGTTVGVLAILTACSDRADMTTPNLPEPETASLRIAHAGVQGSSPHFSFLAPIQPGRGLHGSLDASILDDLVVEILEWNTQVCRSVEVARFSSQGQTPANRVRLAGGHFVVNWNIRDSNVDPRKKYRLRVLLHGTELGHADVVVSDRQRRPSEKTPDGFIAVAAQQTLPIRFRVEVGAVPHRPLRWEQVTSMPVALRGATATTNGLCIYVFGGATMNRGGGWVNLTQSYDPAKDEWGQMAPFSTPRDWAMAAVLPDGIHLLGGSRAGGPGEPANVLIDDHKVYDMSADGWSPRAPLPIALNAAVAHEIDGLLYVIGGGSPSGNIHGMVHIYDWRTDSWRSGTPMPATRHTAASGLINGKIHVAGGQGGQATTFSVTDAHQRYDPATDSWEDLAPLPMAKAGPGGGVILGGGAVDGKFCVFGGIQGLLSAPGTVETFCYDPALDHWNQGPNMLTARGHPAFVSHRNAVYAIGGWTDTGTVTATVERLRR